MRKKLKRLLGFGSAEISLILIIASTMVGSMLALLPVQKGSSDIAVTQERFLKVRTAITAYYQKYGYLPCPASRADAPSTANFGKSTDCTTASAVTGVSETGTSPNTVRIGVVPVRSLNLSDSDMYDSYGNRITYAVIKALAQSSANFTSFTTTATQVISIQDKKGLVINPNSSSTTLNYVPFVLVSHGRDGNGGYNEKGSLVSTCLSSKLQGKNCDNDNVFASAPHNYANSNAFYDDYIYWSGITVLKNATGTSAKSSGACTSSISPADLGSLVLWLDANDLTKITKDASNNVSQWLDKSSNAYACINGGTTKPLYSSTGLNSKPTMSLTGKFGFKCSTMSVALGNMSIFFVAQQTNTANANYLLDVNGASNRFTLNLISNGGTYWYKQGTFSATLPASYASNSYASFIFNAGATTPAQLYVNGTQVATGTTFASQDLKTSFVIGQKYTGAATADFSGNISEVIIYNRTLSIAERQAIEGYLKTKWGF